MYVWHQGRMLLQRLFCTVISSSLQGPVFGAWRAPQHQPSVVVLASAAAAASHADAQRFAAVPLNSGAGMDGILLLRYFPQQPLGDAFNGFLPDSSRISRWQPAPNPAASSTSSPPPVDSAGTDSEDATLLLSNAAQLADLGRYLASILFDGGAGECLARACGDALYVMGSAATLKDMFACAAAAAADLAGGLHCADMHAAMALVPGPSSSHALFAARLRQLHTDSREHAEQADMGQLGAALGGGSSAGPATGGMAAGGSGASGTGGWRRSAHK